MIGSVWGIWQYKKGKHCICCAHNPICTELKRSQKRRLVIAATLVVQFLRLQSIDVLRCWMSIFCTDQLPCCVPCIVCRLTSNTERAVSLLITEGWPWERSQLRQEEPLADKNSQAEKEEGVKKETGCSKPTWTYCSYTDTEVSPTRLCIDVCMCKHACTCVCERVCKYLTDELCLVWRAESCSKDLCGCRTNFSPSQGLERRREKPSGFPKELCC